MATTSIDELPTSGEANITLETTNKPVQQNTQQRISEEQAKNIQLSSSDISKIVEGIQLASSNNMTTLPSRDIPQNQSTITNDPQVQPNHVPEKKGGYVEDFEKAQVDLYKERIQLQQNQEQLDTLYDRLQTPILISILFFLFQLPFVNKTLLSYAPSLFLKERHLTFGGYLCKTILFAGSYYCINHLITGLSMI